MKRFISTRLVNAKEKIRKQKDGYFVINTEHQESKYIVIISLYNNIQGNYTSY